MRGREDWGCVSAALCSMVGDGRKPGRWGRRCYKQMRLQKCWHVCLSLGASWVMKVTMPARCLNHHRITGRPWCQPGQMSGDLLYLRLHFNNVFLTFFHFSAWYNEPLTRLTRQNVPQITGFISPFKLPACVTSKRVMIVWWWWCHAQTNLESFRLEHFRMDVRDFTLEILVIQQLCKVNESWTCTLVFIFFKKIFHILLWSQIETKKNFVLTNFYFFQISTECA